MWKPSFCVLLSSLDVAVANLATFVLLRPWTLTFDLDLQICPRQCQGERACQVLIQRSFHSKDIVRSHRHTRRTNFSTGATKVVSNAVLYDSLLFGSAGHLMHLVVLIINTWLLSLLLSLQMVKLMKNLYSYTFTVYLMMLDTVLSCCPNIKVCE